MGKGGQDEGKRRDGSDSSWSEPATPAFPAWVRTPSECLTELGVSAVRGLSVEEAAARLRRYGPNELERHAAPSVWKLVLKQFDDTLVRILLATAVVSFVLALYDGAEGGEVGATAFVEPLVIFLILIINAVVGVWQESNAEKALEALKETQCARGSPEASREFLAVRLVSSFGFVLGFLDSEGILRESAWIWGGREGSEWRCRVTSSPWWCSSPRSPRPPRSPIPPMQ